MTTDVIETGPAVAAQTAERFTWSLETLPVAMVGQCAAWFEYERDGESVIVRPREALPRRCTIRPAAMFKQARGYTDVMTVMGRLVFPHGAIDEQRYTPFTLDPQRQLKELFLPVEAMPDDDWPMSVTRWTNYQAIARRLLSIAGLSWRGLSTTEIERSVTIGSWTEPLEGCVLHALTQWTHERGSCVIEIGSFRGRSAAMLAVALRGAGSASKVISIDPHEKSPCNAAHVRLAFSEWGEEKRLVQYLGGSEEACEVLRPRCASLVVVDGDHSYGQVVSDFENYRELLAHGGCMAFRDFGCGARNGCDEPERVAHRAIEEHVFAARDFRPLLSAHSLLVFVKEQDRISVG